MPASKTATSNLHDCGQVVLVLQGGGALGAYQAGVYQALHEGGVELDWVIGTSIGAINAALIAGNAPEDRLDRLQAFWSRINRGFLAESAHQLPFGGPLLANALTVANGVSGFFRPNPWAWGSLTMPLGPEQAGFYSTHELAETLTELDERAGVWRIRHLRVVERIIGGEVVGTQGTPVELLAGLVHRKFFPELWDVRNELTELAKEEER